MDQSKENKKGRRPDKAVRQWVNKRLAGTPSSSGAAPDSFETGIANILASTAALAQSPTVPDAAKQLIAAAENLMKAAVEIERASDTPAATAVEQQDDRSKKRQKPLRPGRRERIAARLLSNPPQSDTTQTPKEPRKRASPTASEEAQERPKKSSTTPSQGGQLVLPTRGTSTAPTPPSSNIASETATD